MILKVVDNDQFNLAMNLIVNWDLEYIEITVTLWNKAKHVTKMKTFSAAQFPAAIACFDELKKLVM